MQALRKTARRSRGFRPNLDIALEQRSLMAFTPMGLIGMQGGEAWMQASNYQPSPIYGASNSSSTTTTGGSWSWYNTVFSQSTTTTINDTGSTTGSMMDVMMGVPGASYVNIVDNHTIVTTTNTASDTVDDPASNSNDMLTTDTELIETTTMTRAGATSTFTNTTKETWHRDDSVTPASSTTPSDSDSTDFKEVLTQVGIIDPTGAVAGAYSLTEQGSDRLARRSSVFNGPETDSFQGATSDTWTLTANGNLRPGFDPGSWTITYTGNFSNSNTSTTGFGAGGSSSSPVNPGELASYTDSHNVSVTASGSGSTSASTYTIAGTGSLKGTDLSVSGGTDPVSGITLEVDDQTTNTITYGFNETDGAGTSSQSETGSESVNVLLSGPGGPAGFSASTSGTGGWTAGTGSPLTVTGAGVWGLMPNLYTFTPPPGPPAGTVPYLPAGGAMNAYYNYLAFVWNTGRWTRYPFAGPVPTAPLAVPPAFAQKVVLASSSGEFACYGSAIANGLADPKTSFYTGVILVPYDGGIGGRPGIVIQYFWNGFFMQMIDTNAPVP